MKLRIKGDSLRLRIAPSEVTGLIDSGRVEETIHFGPQEHARLTYALEHADGETMRVEYAGGRVAVILPSPAFRAWVVGNDAGIYGSVAISGGRLEIAVEKDWACLDQGEPDDADTFPNPKQGANC